MTRCMLTDDIWYSLRVILTDTGCYLTYGLRLSVEGILWRIRTGSPWRDMPSDFGSWNSVYRLFNRWTCKGYIDVLLQTVEGKIDYRTAYIDGTYISVHQHASGCAKDQESSIGMSRGGRTTKLHVVCDRQGQPVEVEVTSGNVHDLTQAEEMIDDLTSIFDEIVADKGYDSDSFRLDILCAGANPVIPIKSTSNRKNPGFHKSKYKKRHRVENLIARLKHFRGIATRYDKLKKIFASSVKWGLVAIWLGLTI
jgi:transposase